MFERSEQDKGYAEYVLHVGNPNRRPGPARMWSRWFLQTSAVSVQRLLLCRSIWNPYFRIRPWRIRSLVSGTRSAFCRCTFPINKHELLLGFTHLYIYRTFIIFLIINMFLKGQKVWYQPLLDDWRLQSSWDLENLLDFRFLVVKVFFQIFFGFYIP